MARRGGGCAWRLRPAAARAGRSAGPATRRSAPSIRGPRGTRRRSVSVRSSTRTMCGVSVRMMSVCVRLGLVVREQPADDRQVAQARDAVQRAPLVVADEPGQHVGFAVAQPDHRVDLAIAERRQTAEAGSRDALNADFQRQRHVVVVVRARRDVDVDADVLVVERRDRLLRRAAGGDRRERRDRHRHALAEPRLRGHAFRGPQLRVGQRPRVGVGLEQPVVERRAGWRAGRRPASGCAAPAGSASGWRRVSMRHRPVDARASPATRSAARIPAAACDPPRAARRR